MPRPNSLESSLNPEVANALENAEALSSVQARLRAGEKLSTADAQADLLSALETRKEGLEEGADSAVLDGLIESINSYPDDVEAYLESIGCEGPETQRLKEEIEKGKDKVKSLDYYTDTDYGAVEALNAMFEKQAANIANAEPKERLEKLAAQVSALEGTYETLNTIGGIFPKQAPDSFTDGFGVDIWKEGNDLVVEGLSTWSWSKLNEAKASVQAAADKIDEEYEKFLEAKNYLREPDTINRTVSHLFDTETEPDSIDAAKLQKMLENSSHLGLLIDPRIKDHFSEELLGNYLNRVKLQYRTKLEINKSRVDGTYAEILRTSLERRFKTKEEYDEFIAQSMREQLPEFYAARTKNQAKMLPDSVWDSKRQQRSNEADRNWETYLNKGEEDVWLRLDERLSEAKSQKFATKADYIKYLKETTKDLSAEKYIPDEIWDLRIKDRFKDRVENQWQDRLDRGAKEAQKIVDDLFKKAEKESFGSFAELQKYLRLTTAKLDKDKTVPDDYWQAEMRPAFHAREKVLWSRMEATKKQDSKAVEKAMLKASLAPGKITGKPKTEADFFKLAKKQLPAGIKGKLTDADWDNHMEAYFYPHLKAQLKQNQQTVSNAMRNFAAPSLEDRLKCKSKADYLRFVKQQFSDQNQKIMGLIPNAQYDTLRDRLLVSRAREQWRSHEKTESLQFREAQGALNTNNLLRTVHHFAKNKKNPNPTMADIKSSSSHALTAQFSLRPDQIKSLDKDLKNYATQALAMHKTRRQSALKTIDRYKAPAEQTFTDSELKTSASFYDAMVRAVGYINFTHADDWYLVEPEAMTHIEGLRQAQLALTTEEAANDNLTSANDNEPATEIETTEEDEAKSETLKETVVENNGKHPAEQTEWMKRFGIPTESVSQKGVERFSKVMNLPEFNLGGIPRSDLKIALPALVNMLGGFRETTWKNFTPRIRTDMRSLENKDPQSRFFQIIKSFATGFPYKLTDFDVVPGIDNVFNNLVKRTKGPDGEKFTTIKNLYIHYFKPEDREALEMEISDEEFEEQMLAFLEEDELLMEDEETAEETELTEEVEDTETELLPTETVAEEEVDTEDNEAPEEIVETEEAVETLETETPETTETIPEIPTEMIDTGIGTGDEELAEEILEPEVVEITEVEEEEGEELVETENVEDEAEDETVEDIVETEDVLETPEEPSDAISSVTDKMATAESVTNPDEAYNDYLKEGAVVLTEVDQILRQPHLNEEEDEIKAEEQEREAELIAQQQEEVRPEEIKAPIDEAAEVVPEKLHKILLKLSSMGLLSDEAISWLLEQSMEFAVIEDDACLTLAQALKLIEISLQSQFLARNLQFTVSLNQSVQAKAVTNLGPFIQDFIAQTQVVDGLQSVTVNAYRSGALRGYFSTRFGKKSFAIKCVLVKAKKKANKLS